MMREEYRFPRPAVQAVEPRHQAVELAHRAVGPGHPSLEPMRQSAEPRHQSVRHGKADRIPWGLLLTSSISILAWGCAPPDHPDRLPGPLPEALLVSLQPAEVRALSPGPGTAYFGVTSDAGPWAIHLLRVDLNRCDLGLEVVRAPKQEELPGGRSRVTELRRLLGRPVLAAVNGDFFTPEGLPVGTEVVGGIVRQTRDRPVFAWRPGELPWMGTPSTEGDSVLVVGWRIPRKESDGVSQVIGGFPRLLARGQRVGDLRVTDLPSFAAARHPRTAVGFDPSRGHLWIVGVDGRQEGYSEGMTLPELTALFEALGATEAVNLDGGGSTVMTLRGVVVSHPSDAEGERPVVNALMVVRDPGFCGVGGS